MNASAHLDMRVYHVFYAKEFLLAWAAKWILNVLTMPNVRIQYAVVGEGLRSKIQIASIGTNVAGQIRVASLQCATTHQERIGVNVSQAIKVLLQKYLAEILMNVWRSRSHVVRIQSV